MVNGRFIVPQTAPISNTAYTVRGSKVIKGYVISNDDQFSPDGNVGLHGQRGQCRQSDEPGDARAASDPDGRRRHLYAEFPGRLREHAAGRG